MIQAYMEINGNFQFSQIWHDETFEALFRCHNISTMDKIFE